jgi:hypothetical protein
MDAEATEKAFSLKISEPRVIAAPAVSLARVESLVDHELLCQSDRKPCSIVVFVMVFVGLSTRLAGQYPNSFSPQRHPSALSSENLFV